jgi:hypothetical protein
MHPYYSHWASWAVNLFFGSRISIFLTKSFALSDMLGQGSVEKSRSPFKTCSNIPCSLSAPKINRKIKLMPMSVSHKIAMQYFTKKATYNLTIPEWRDSTQKDIDYDTSTPHVNLSAIVF